MIEPTTNRRQFVLASVAAGAAAGNLSRLARAGEAQPTRRLPRATADSCIFIWLGGGACHVDTWDPKRLSKGPKDPGSYYASIPTSVPEIRISEHLSRTAPLLDRCVLLRSVHHTVVDEHAAATHRMHVGRPPTGTTVYPSIGSIVAQELGPRGDGVPAYVVMGYPNSSRSPGFLGARGGYIYLTETSAGPAALQLPHGVDRRRQARRERLLGNLREQYAARHPQDQRVAEYSATSVDAFRLASGKFASVFDLGSENSTLREAYGDEFGQRCLLARRLTQEGVRFVEVSFNLNFLNGTGWDTHNQGQLKQHLLIRDLDRAFSTLLVDLERHRRLDKTLVVIATEFGRPPEFDAGGGRGHQSRAFSIVLAGGGLKTAQAVGATDDLGKKIVSRPVSVPDLHATIHAALGIDPSKELYDGQRPVPITDHGTPVREVYAV
jgi:Protein of unknown function (DUF1501)